MMAKEKANELVTEYQYHCGGSNIIQLRAYAKQCALIAVDELEKALIEYGRANDELQNMDREFKYWQEVRKEIEKL